MIVPVILSGGAGTRLWPVSRLRTPKQFAQLIGEESLIQATARRIARLGETAEPIVVCNDQHVETIKTQLEGIGLSPRFIVEPIGRNTAPAAAVAALAAGSDALLLVLPSDHLISDPEALKEAVEVAAAYAADGHIVTFGIVPDRPETGYGYIRKGAELDAAFSIDRFVEKPDTETAAAYLESGEYLWNSGMFLFQADIYLSALDRHAPEMAEALTAVISASDIAGDTLSLDEATFAACPSDSVDYAVMEHIDNGVVIPLDAGWSDIGSWDVIWELSKTDGDGNVLDGDITTEGVTNSLIRGGDRLVAVVGLDNVVVVDTGDALLVAAKDHAQDVKKLVDRLRDGRRPEV